MKRIKLKHNRLWDSTSIVHENKLLSTILEDSGWIDLPLESGVSPAGYSGVPRYRKIGNIVTIQGSVTFNKGTDFKGIATLPEKFRPKNLLYYFSPIGGINSGQNIQRICIHSDTGLIECEWIRSLENEKNPAVTGTIPWADINIVFLI